MVVEPVMVWSWSSSCLFERFQCSTPFNYCGKHGSHYSSLSLIPKTDKDQRSFAETPMQDNRYIYIYILTSHHVTSNHLTSHYITLDHATSRETKLHRMIYDICVYTYMYCHIQIRMSYVYIIEVLWFQTWLYEAPPSSAGKVESQRCSHWTIVAVCHGATDGENDCLFVWLQQIVSFTSTWEIS